MTIEDLSDDADLDDLEALTTGGNPDELHSKRPKKADTDPVVPGLVVFPRGPQAKALAVPGGSAAVRAKKCKSCFIHTTERMRGTEEGSDRLQRMAKAPAQMLCEDCELWRRGHKDSANKMG